MLTTYILLYTERCCEWIIVIQVSYYEVGDFLKSLPPSHSLSLEKKPADNKEEKRFLTCV